MMVCEGENVGLKVGSKVMVKVGNDVIDSQRASTMNLLKD